METILPQILASVINDIKLYSTLRSDFLRSDAFVESKQRNFIPVFDVKAFSLICEIGNRKQVKQMTEGGKKVAKTDFLSLKKDALFPISPLATPIH